MGATLCISLGFLLFYFEQIRVFKAGNRALNTSAWIMEQDWGPDFVGFWDLSND